MTYAQTLRKRTLLIASAGLFTLLAGCATATTGDTAEAEKITMRADCQAMHDTMMAGNAMGDMPDHKMMSPAMMEKHQACMEMMPDMKAKMKEKCATLKAGAMDQDMMDHDRMGKSMMDHEKMADHCAMMKSHSDRAGQ